MAAITGLEVRLKVSSKARIEQAAKLLDVSVSDFVRSAAEHRAAQLLGDRDATTLVGSEYFDDLLTALDGPVRPDPALDKAFDRVGMADALDLEVTLTRRRAPAAHPSVG